jgi:hypothetical protein
MTQFEITSFKIVDPVSHVRRAKVMYLGREEVIPQNLATNLINDALTLGATRVEVHHCGKWWLVSSADDWLVRETDVTIEETFRRLVPLVGGGLEALRREILLTAFASAVFTKKGDDLLWITDVHQKHDLKLAECLKAIPHDHRVIGFTVDSQEHK